MSSQSTFVRVTSIVADAVAARAFPCASIEIGSHTEVIWRTATGRFTYDPDAPEATPDTIFDLASLTKVLASTTIALQHVANGRLQLETPVAESIACWTARDRASVRVRDLLEHCSGLPAHRDYFRSRSGRKDYQRSICDEPLEYEPRTQAIYSDLGFMMLGFVLEDAAHAPLDVQFAGWARTIEISEPIAYRPPTHWMERIAPTEQDTWRGRLLVGEVHDENAAALGGVAAHAGLFGTAAGVGQCARWWLQLLMGKDDERTGVLSSDASGFTQRSAVPGSSRALGWDHMRPTSSCGSRLSPRAVGHTGFTGTSLWIDPERDLYAVLLTNRVHPIRNNDAIRQVRRAFHDAVVEDLSPG